MRSDHDTPMTPNRIHQVSDTAFMAAAYRAMESQRKHALFHDPLAAKLAGTRGQQIVASLPKKAFVGGWTVVIRTTVIDALIQAAVAEGVDTILNLGAGLDSRPYRLTLPSTLHWIEADLPHVIDLKQEQLSGETPCCQLTRVGLDLANVDARRTFLCDVVAQSRKVLVLTEAVIPYLSQDQVASLAMDLRSHAVVKYWLVDYFSPASYAYRRRSGMSQAMKQAPFLFEPQDYFGFFRQTGWQPRETRYFAIEAQRLGRPAPFPWPIKLITSIAGLMASPERRMEMKRYAGFTLFEPATSDSETTSSGQHEAP